MKTIAFEMVFIIWQDMKKFLKRAKQLAAVAYRTAKRAIADPYQDILAARRLMAIEKKCFSAGGTTKVAFLVFGVESWDKTEPVYQEICSREYVQADIIVIPNYTPHIAVATEYGPELAFFQENYTNVIPALKEDGTWIDISTAGYEYVFYQVPYDLHYPDTLKSTTLSEFAKICYIPYGYWGADVFNSSYQKAFLRNAYYVFIDSKYMQEVVANKGKAYVDKGTLRVEFLGYPSLERYINQSNRETHLNRILWTPRWSFDSKIGGSNFFEYKDGVLEIPKNFPQASVAMRPHPLLFGELLYRQMMSEQEIEDYKRELDKRGIFLSLGNSLEKDLEHTDVLISDFSSIMMPFFLTNRPIIYCTSHIVLNREFERISEGMYIADTWEDVQKHLKEIISGNDYLKPVREKIIQEYAEEHLGSTKRIVDKLLAHN